MIVDESINAAKDGVSVVAELMKAAGDNPKVKEAGGNLGKTAITVTETINNVLLPLAAVNFAIKKARTYFEGKFQTEIEQKISVIPSERLIEPKASIAGPVLQGLAFVHEEPSLKDMFLNLLATAMDMNVSSDAHPAFVEVIKQMNAEEASFLRSILSTKTIIPVVEIRLVEEGVEGWSVLANHLLNARYDFSSSILPYSIIENPRIPAMVDNWIRLGLIGVYYDKFMTEPNAYDWVEKRPEFVGFKSQMENDKQKVIFVKGVIMKTSFGVQFARVVGLPT